MTPTPEHIVENCLVAEIEAVLDSLAPRYDLIGSSTCQVGTGYGAHVEATLIFKLKVKQEEAAPRGRRRPMMPIPPKNKTLTRTTVSAVSSK